MFDFTSPETFPFVFLNQQHAVQSPETSALL
jgi:hypothetical protein